MIYRELIKLAAKACGYWWSVRIEEMREEKEILGLWVSGVSTAWNPLHDSGHAFDLAVKLRLDIRHQSGIVYVGDAGAGKWLAYESHEEDAAIATCLAITRAAAEIGKNMSDTQNCASGSVVQSDGESDAAEITYEQTARLASLTMKAIAAEERLHDGLAIDRQVHQWDENGKRCLRCGDKDWFAGSECKPTVKAHACRPEDREMIATPAGQELLECAIGVLAGSAGLESNPKQSSIQYPQYLGIALTTAQTIANRLPDSGFKGGDARHVSAVQILVYEAISQAINQYLHELDD